MEDQRRIISTNVIVISILLIALVSGAGLIFYKVISRKTPQTSSAPTLPANKDTTRSPLSELPICGPDNSFHSLSSTLGQYSKVCLLAMQNEPIRNLIGKEKAFTNLKILILQGNQLYKIPFDVSLIPSIEILDLRNNKITRFPDNISNLTSLKLLRISNNKLSDEEKKRIRKLLPDTQIEF